jgi:hypothetical protein
MFDNHINHWQEGFIPEAPNNPKNQTLYWSGLDSLENFKKNPTPGYTETSITYVYNSYGYREEEYDLTSQSNILCLGCSHTEGIGLRFEDSWPTLLKKQFSNSKVYNFGLGGGSSDTVARILTNISSIFNPLAVFILWPSTIRYELYNGGKPVFYGTWSIDAEHYSLMDSKHTYNNFCKNKLIVELLQKRYNFNLCSIEVDSLPYDIDFKRLGERSSARDLHFNPHQHQEIARRFIEKYNAN